MNHLMLTSKTLISLLSKNGVIQSKGPEQQHRDGHQQGALNSWPASEVITHPVASCRPALKEAALQLPGRALAPHLLHAQEGSFFPKESQSFPQLPGPHVASQLAEKLTFFPIAFHAVLHERLELVTRIG